MKFWKLLLCINVPVYSKVINTDTNTIPSSWVIEKNQIGFPTWNISLANHLTRCEHFCSKYLFTFMWKTVDQVVFHLMLIAIIINGYNKGMFNWKVPQKLHYYSSLNPTSGALVVWPGSRTVVVIKLRIPMLAHCWAPAGLNSFVQEDLSGIQQMIIFWLPKSPPQEPLSPCQWLSSLLSLNPHCQGLLRHSPLAGLRPVRWLLDCRRRSQASGKNYPRVSFNSLLRLAPILAAEQMEAGRSHRKKQQ